MKYKEANQQLTGRNQQSRKIANHTYLQRRGNDIAVKFHETDVVTFHPNGQTTLNSGGWQTKTTKERINEFSPVYVTQDKGIWYVGKSLFTDGMKINRNGNPIKGKSPASFEKKKRKIDKLVSNYISGFIQDIKENGLQDPSGGDCWMCSMQTESGETLGDVSNSDHLLSHFKEKYYVPSLLFNAIKSQNYAHPEFIWRLINKNSTDIARRTLQYYFRNRKTALTNSI